MLVITMADILIFISIENFSLLCTSVRVQILEILELSPGAKELITWIVDIKLLNAGTWCWPRALITLFIFVLSCILGKRPNFASNSFTIYVHLPSILPYTCGGCPTLSPTAPPQWRDAHSKRLWEGPWPHPTPHRPTRLDSPPPPHTHIVERKLIIIR